MIVFFLLVLINVITAFLRDREYKDKHTKQTNEEIDKKRKYE